MSEAEVRNRLGRAFNAAIGAEWMITEDGLRTLLAIAARVPKDLGVEAQDADRLEYTRECTVRDGVAIIPVEGPIFRYANLFTYFSGGTSVDVLGKDFTSALDNPAVHAILFAIDSPGGEVNGINEFCEMIYNARDRKPMTARVGGLGCSAAYWIASACGDIVIDETAMLGSIGVMAVYTDDRKALEMHGLEELEFISSQSPFKNAAPWKDEGKIRIQKRIDALASVFVEKVARNRGVSVDTVLENYGQGDVLVGQAAIAAGLADRLGSFETALLDLARTHNPYFIERGEKTINDQSRVSSKTVEIVSAEDEPEISTEEGEFMSEQNQDLETSAAEGTAETANAPAPQAAPAAGPAAAPAPEKPVEDVATLRTELERSREEAARAAARIEALEAEATDRWIADKVSGLQGSAEGQTAVLGALVKAYGKDSKEVAAFLELQTAQATQIEKGGLFGQIGKGGAETDNSAEAQLEAKAKELMAADASLTIQQARAKAYEQHPDLYAQL